MNKADLEKIVAIAEEGSMARASQKLFITQPALSKALTKVEEELGETLFTRRGMFSPQSLPDFKAVQRC